MSDLGDPVVTAAGDDTGAETLQRYRYQASYAAWLAVGSLEEMPDVVAIYCEHHDDVLLELVGGVCDAIQIKTQASGVGPLKGNTKPILTALRRFVEFEHAFGDRFRHYRLASISGFHRTGKATSNLDHCLTQARTCTDPAAPGSPLVTLIKQIKAPAVIPPDIVVAALRKVQLDATLPKLEDIEMRVRRAIERLPETAHYRASDLLQGAYAVIQLAMRAGEATQGTAASDYVAYLADPEGHATRAAIEAKRLSPDAVRRTIHQAVEEAAVLRSKEGSDVSRLPSDARMAHRKMDAGGLPVHTVGLLDDLRSSAEEAIGRRLYRDGPDRTNADYDHVQVLVRSIAEDARLSTRTPDDEYGQAMYAELRRQLRDQSTTDPESTRGLSVEQMTGVAAILTELCQVWWGDPFDLEGSA